MIHSPLSLPRTTHKKKWCENQYGGGGTPPPHSNTTLVQFDTLFIMFCTARPRTPAPSHNNTSGRIRTRGRQVRVAVTFCARILEPVILPEFIHILPQSLQVNKISHKWLIPVPIWNDTEISLLNLRLGTIQSIPALYSEGTRFRPHQCLKYIYL